MRIVRATLLLPILASFSCAGAGSTTSTQATVEITPPVPPSASATTSSTAPIARAGSIAWSGVYFSITLGHLHITEEGGRATGKWMRPTKDRWGELHGSVNGDTMTFEWSEHATTSDESTPGPKGRGALRYQHPRSGREDPTLTGELKSDAGTAQAFEAVKQRNARPDSIPTAGGDWD